MALDVTILEILSDNYAYVVRDGDDVGESIQAIAGESKGCAVARQVVALVAAKIDPT